MERKENDKIKTTFLGKQNSGLEPIFLQNKWIFLKMKLNLFTKRSQGKSCHLEMLLSKWNANDGDEQQASKEYVQLPSHQRATTVSYLIFS